MLSFFKQLYENSFLNKAVSRVIHIFKCSFLYERAMSVINSADTSYAFKVFAMPYNLLKKIPVHPFLRYSYSLKYYKAALPLGIMLPFALLLSGGSSALIFVLPLYFLVNPTIGIYTVTALCMMADTEFLFLCMVMTVAGFFGKSACIKEYGGQVRHIDLLVVLFAFLLIVFGGNIASGDFAATGIFALYYIAVQASINKERDIATLSLLYVAAVGVAAIFEIGGADDILVKSFKGSGGGIFEFYILSIPFVLVYAARQGGIKRAVSVISAAALILSLLKHLPPGMGIYETAAVLLFLAVRDIRFVVPAVAVAGTLLSFAGFGKINELNRVYAGNFLMHGADIAKVGIGILLAGAVYAYAENKTRKKALVRSAGVAIMGAGAIYIGGAGGNLRAAIVFWVLLALNFIRKNLP